MPDLIRQAVRKLQTKHGFKVCEALTAVLTTTEHTRLLTTQPTDWFRWRDVPYRIEVEGRARPLTILDSRADANRLFSTTAGGEHTPANIAGPPEALLISEPTSVSGAADIEVYPLPDGLSTYANGEYRIQIPYWKYLPALSGDTDTNWFTENADEFIVYQATADAFFLNWDSNSGTLWQQRAAAKQADAITLDKKARWSGITTLHVSPRAGGGNYGVR